VDRHLEFVAGRCRPNTLGVRWRAEVGRKLELHGSARFVRSVRVVSFKDVNIEELAKSDLRVPEEP